MIMAVTEFKQFVPQPSVSDQVLQAMLEALELTIRAYTNNNFQNRSFRNNCKILDGKLVTDYALFAVGNTVEISNSLYNNGVYTISTISNGEISLNKVLVDENSVTVTRIDYPADVKFGAVNLMKYDLDKRDKAGIASETISRHSVSYVDATGSNTASGYPVALMGFLKPYIRARFGRGF